MPLPLLLCAVLALPAAEPARTQTFHEPLAMGAKLWIRQDDGKVDVKGWDKPEVQLVAEFVKGRGGHEASLDLNRVAEGLEIIVNHHRRHHFGFTFVIGRNSGPVVNLTLMVPRKLSTDIRSIDGAISVQDLEGYAGLTTVDGPIQLHAIKGEVHLQAVDATITGSDLDARVKGGCVDGNITLARVAGGLDLHTIDGNIKVEDLDGWGEGIKLVTVDGNIQARLGQAKGNLEARTADGGIRCAIPGITSVSGKGNRLSGTIPGRDQKITLRTVDGRIELD